MRQIRFLFYIFILSALGCECPPGADTPKEIIPSEYSTVTVFNAINDMDFIKVDTKYGSFIKSLNYKSFSELNKKIGAGNNMLALFNYDDKCFYRGGLYFKKDTNYTTVLTGNEIIVAAINVENNTSNLKKDSAYVKIINAVMLDDSYDITVGSHYFPNQTLGSSTEFFSVPSGYNFLLIKKSETQILNLQVEINKGYYYTIVIFYDPQMNSNYRINTGLIQMPIK